MAIQEYSSEIITTGGKVHKRSHQIARVILVISFVAVTPLLIFTLNRFIVSNGFFVFLGVLFAFGFVYYFLIPAKYIPRFGYLVADVVFYSLIVAIFWHTDAFVGAQIVFFYMLLFGIIDAMSYYWRDVIITLMGTGAAIIFYNAAKLMPEMQFSFLEIVGLTSIELIILTLLTVETRVLADEALAVQKQIIELHTELTRLKEIDRLKTEFIGVVSHQMRTPLSGVKWALSMLKEADAQFTDMQKTIVRLAFENINRMIAVVSNMLDITKVEEQATLLAPERSVLRALIDEIAADMALLAAEKKVSLDIDVPEGLTLIAIRGSLKQAIANVVDNAIRYSHTPGSTVFISSWRDRADIVIRIVDRGIGMTEEEIAKMFTKFFRSPEAIKASPDGSGLGLYYSKRTIEQHGGSIEVSSEPDKGTTVTIKIPIEPHGQ